jgi:hypothetical protein
MNDLSEFYKAKEKQRRVRCFLDGINWQHHLEGDPHGTLLYSDKKDLIEGAGHDLTSCGIVEVEIRLIKWVTPQNLSFHPLDEEDLKDTTDESD